MMKTLLHPRTHTRIEAIRTSPHQSYILHGARSVGKASAALEVARLLNCQCGDSGPCAACRQFEAGAYPDLVMIQPEDKPSIVIEQIRSLVQALSLSPYYPGGVRVVIIDGADLMTTEAQNALLKLIEEPPAGTTFILVAEQLQALLVTVRSRCQAIHVIKPPAADTVALLGRLHNLKPSDAATLVAAADGLPGAAIRLATSPAEAQARLKLQELAAAIPGMTRFERLLAAGRLISAKDDLARLGRVLQARYVAELKAGPDADTARSAAAGLEALETFRRHLAAKLSPRVALERLMLEL